MFKMYACGCIGFVTNGTAIEPGAKRVRCIKPCDGDRDSPTYDIVERDALQTKSSRKLTDKEIELLFDELAGLVDDGNKLRDLRVAMRVAGIV
jgi:hypothetical protein